MALTTILHAYRTLSPLWRSVVFGFLCVLPVLASAFVTYYLKLSLEKTLQVQLLLVLFLFFIFVVVRRYIELKLETLDKVTEAQRNSLGQAYASLDALVARRLRHMHTALDQYEQRADATALFLASIASLRHIQDLVEALYHVVDSQFGQAGSLLTAIEFEVTFMTKSYLDQKITIYAYQNRDHRAPRSLLMRANNPDIYDATVTADIYREARPDMHVVENTTKEPYVEVYPGQRDRIKSSVIYPVLSDSNELLGTIVIHCNQAGLFRRSEVAFWRKLLEIYAKRIAYEKSYLDLFSSLNFAAWAKQVNPQDALPNH